MARLTSLLAFAVGATSLFVSYPVQALKSTASTPKLIMYVQTFHVNGDSNTPLSLLPLRDESTGITHVIFAMTHLNSAPGDIHLNDNPYNATVFDQAWSDAKQLQAAGIKVMATMGGAGDVSYSRLASDFNAYYQPLLALIKQYSLDGFDLDVEESADLSTMLQLINSLYTDMGPDFLITLAPVASALASPSGGDLSGFSYFDLDSQAVSSSGTKLVSWYNGQFYSGFGSPASTSTYDSIVSAGWDPARVVMGVIDAQNDGSGWVALGTVQSTIASLEAKYPTFGGVDGWEYFDAGSSDGDAEPWQWVKSIGSALFGTAASKRTAVQEAIEERAGAAELPESPFSKTQIAKLRSLGATHFEAVRALNRTAGNLAAARSLVYEHLARKLK